MRRDPRAAGLLQDRDSEPPEGAALAWGLGSTAGVHVRADPDARRGPPPQLAQPAGLRIPRGSFVLLGLAEEGEGATWMLRHDGELLLLLTPRTAPKLTPAKPPLFPAPLPLPRRSLLAPEREEASAVPPTPPFHNI